jgi:hypothetical protein
MIKLGKVNASEVLRGVIAIYLAVGPFAEKRKAGTLSANQQTGS